MVVALNCTFCQNAYDLESRLPHVAPCGHSLCNACLTEFRTQKFMQCKSCGTGFAVAIFPVNYGLKDQLEEQPATEKKDICDFVPPYSPTPGWTCSECALPLHHKHARVCIRCTPKDVVENKVDGLLIHDYEKTESQLVCAHCVMESRHRFHITKLYLPAKLRQHASARFSDLVDRCCSSSANKEESEIVRQALCVLRDRSLSCVSWSSFEQHWNEAEEMVLNMEDLNRGINDGLKRVEEALKDIEHCQTEKQAVLDRLTSVVARKCVSPSAKRRSRSVATTRRLKRTSSSDSDTDSTSSSCSLLRRFGALPDLTRVGTDEED